MEKKRNGNVEAFRIVLMAGIVSMHILGHGHLLELSSGSAEKVLWLIESLAIPASIVLLSSPVIFSQRPCLSHIKSSH